MSPRNKAIKELEENDYIFERHGSNHDIYKNHKTHRSIAIKRHDFKENDLRYIEKEIRQNECVQEQREIDDELER